VNCGTSPGETKWESALRASAAHSALVLDDRNSAEIASDGTPGKRPASVTTERGENDDGAWIEGEHDGYVPTHGMRHRRRLFLASDGDTIEGVDTLERTTTTGDVTAPREITVRFHLHPRIGASVVQSGASVLLRTPSGGGWRVRADVPATLNESVYFGDAGRLQRAEQIVLAVTPRQGSDGPVEIRWSIRREDAGKAG
jgi:uncharacterized heparinase superfamily protein